MSCVDAQAFLHYSSADSEGSFAKNAQGTTSNMTLIISLTSFFLLFVSGPQYKWYFTCLSKKNHTFCWWHNYIVSFELIGSCTTILYPYAQLRIHEFECSLEYFYFHMETTPTSAELLLPDVLAKIFCLLEVRYKGRATQVCRAWRDVAYIPSVWRDVEVSKLSPASLVDIYVQRGIRRIRFPPASSNINTWLLDLRHFLAHCDRTVAMESMDLSECVSLTGHWPAEKDVEVFESSQYRLLLSTSGGLHRRHRRWMSKPVEAAAWGLLRIRSTAQSSYVWKSLSRLRRLRHLDQTDCP